MDALDKTAIILVILSIILITGATMVYSLPLWLSIQQLTTPLEEGAQIAQETHSYVLERTTTSNPQISGFTSRENSHMADVKKVIISLETFLLLSLLILIGISLQSTKKAEILFKASTATMVLFIVLMIIPFEILFVKFHQVFFDPGTWVFSSGLMIQAFPRSFFMWMAQLWWIRVFITAAIICILSFGYLRFRKTTGNSAQ